MADRQGREAPWYGCLGAPYTYSFTPVAFDMQVKVTNNFTGESLEFFDGSCRCSI